MEISQISVLSIKTTMNKSLYLCCRAAVAIIITNSCSKKTPYSESKEKENSESTVTEQKYREPDKKVGYAVADSSAPHSLTSSAAVDQSRDGMRFVRTADVKFQVSNVTEATYHIEDVTTQYGGFVTYTDLHSTVSNTETVPISADSSLNITNFSVENDITLRLPNKRLDSALRAMSGLVDFLDHRIIVATEVSNQSLANDMAEKRNKEYQQRLMKHADNSILKPDASTAAEDKALQGREAADNAHLANLSLDNQVKYSTVHLLIYQRQSSRKVKVCNESNIARYKPSFGIQLWEALGSGLDAFESLMVAIAHLWMFIILTVIGFVGYRKYKGK